MKFFKNAIFLVTVPALVAADAGSVKSMEVFSDGDGGNGVRGGHMTPAFLETGWGDGQQQMCQSCSAHAGCATGFCSWSYVCYDNADKRGADGCRCVSDENCKSGRCASNFGCAPKVENGGGCALSDDCVENFCGWDFTCHPLCKDKKVDVPFMVTNVKLTPEGQEHYWGYHSDSSEDEFKFLKNVKYCPDAGALYAYRIYGELISEEEFKSEVETFVESSPVFDHVLYNIHGFNVDPAGSFMGAHDFNREDSDGWKTGYLVIPINWRNVWGAQFFSYEYDRNNNAIKAGKSLGAQMGFFNLSVKTSLMCHSMGNYVMRLMAQEAENPEQAFENIFMVAADARLDMFSTEFNPDAPGATVLLDAPTEQINIPAEELVKIPPEELRENGGYAITKLTKHVHVAWNLGDHALMARETFQIGFGDNVRKAIGKYGDQAKAMTTLPYFTERVTYHDMSKAIEFFGLEHSYQFMPPLVTMYEEYKSSETSNMLLSTM